MDNRYKKIKDKVLGKRYELDLIFVGSKMMKKLNKTYRHKNKDTNVLAFSLSPEVGQIFLNPDFIKKEGAKPLALYIHGLLHLSGYNHGRMMDTEEKKLCREI